MNIVAKFYTVQYCNFIRSVAWPTTTIKDRSQTTLTSFYIFRPPTPLIYTFYLIKVFLNTYPPLHVNVVSERPLTTQTRPDQNRPNENFYEMHFSG